jgi:transcriptional regulator with XRE-family HTH domain
MNKSEIGLNIKKYREKQGITQEELGLAIGKSKNAISNWENELHSPDIYSIMLLIDVFKIDANTLFGYVSLELNTLLYNNPKLIYAYNLLKSLTVEDLELVDNLIKRLSNTNL